MPLVAAHKLDIDCGSPQIYCAMDSMITREVLTELKELLPKPDAPIEKRGPQLIYDFERALQAPAIEIMLRGWRIDPWARDLGISELNQRQIRLSYIIDRLVGSFWDHKSPTKPNNDWPRPNVVNPTSTKQLQTLFYEVMKIPPIIRRNKEGKETMPMERDILERLDTYFVARPIIQAILAYRDCCSQREVLESEVDEDWRMRCSYNPAHATTGRFSSSKSVIGTGRNMQNIEESLRYMFISDPGKKLLGADHEQAETRDTGFLCWVLFGDPSYLDSAEGGDPHTDLAKIIWPNLAWTGDAKSDRKVADQIFYRHHSYREVAKRLRHGTEKGGGAQEIARQIRVPFKLVKEAQNRLFAAFPVLNRYFTWIIGQLQRERYLVDVFGSRRDFFGRPDSSDTIKEAIAYMSQSPTGRRLNLGFWRVWRYMGPNSETPFELLAQLHDAIYGQRSECDTDEAQVVATIKRHLDVPLSFRNRVFTVPSEVKTGWCWSNAHGIGEDGAPFLKHPDGLMKFTGSDKRARTGKIFETSNKKAA